MKKVKELNIFLKELVLGSHLLSLGAGAGIVFSALKLVNKDVNFFLLFLAYLSLQIIYNYDHISDLKRECSTNPERNKHLEGRSLLVVLYIVFLILLSFFVNYQVFLFFLFFTIGGVAYTTKLKSVTQNIVAFKNIYTSIFIALIPLVVLLEHGSHYDNVITLLLFSSFVFLRLFLNTIYFDIKDIDDDKKNNLKTIPVLLGKRKTLKFLQVLNFITILPIVFGFIFGVLPAFSLFLILFYFYSLWYLLKTSNLNIEKIRSWSYLMVDGEYIFWPLVLFIGSLIL